jgi:hypothetical protein
MSVDFIVNEKKLSIIFAGSPFDYALDPYVIISSAGGGALGYGY